MALFDTLEKNNPETSKPSGFIHSLNLGVLYALPLALVVRDETLAVIYQNKVMELLVQREATNYYKQNRLQRAIQKKATLLFNETNDKNTQNFEVSCEGQFFEIHQTLQLAYTGERFIIETIKDITVQKVDDLVERLLSVEGGEEQSNNFLNHFTRSLAEIFQLDMVMVAKTYLKKTSNKSLSCMMHGQLLPEFTYALKDTPCSVIYQLEQPLEIEKGARALFPYSSFINTNRLDAIYAIPLFNPEGKISGVVALGHRVEIPHLFLLKQILQKLTTKLTLEVSFVTYQTTLDNKKEYFRQALNSFKDPVCIFNKQFKLRDYNDAYALHIDNIYNIDVTKSKSIINEIHQTIINKTNHSHELALFHQRKELFEKAFRGEKQTLFIELEREQVKKQYLYTCHPIYNLEQKEIGEVLLIVQDISELTVSQKELALLKKHYHSIFETNLLGIGIYDSIDEKWLDFNQSFFNLFGATSKEQALQIKVGELSPKYQPNGKRSSVLLSNLSKMMSRNEKFTTPWTHKRMDGSTFPSITSFIPLNDEKQPGLYCVAIKDMSEHLAHQTLLEQKNQELEQYIKSNLQLENLAYSACHDLKEPLRTIGTFTQIIKNKYENSIDDKSKEYMNFIINGVTRMNYFVDGLFEYARVRDSKNEFEPFSLSALLKYIQLDLDQTISEKNALIELTNIPDEITGNRTKIKQLFQNLITNAIKFKRPDIQPVVKIACTSSESHWHFTISDNGIGIAPEYFEQIFILFRKLHSKDQYEGSGIGLALCKEIVEQHKGDIHVTSKVAHGTSFNFTFAKNLSI
jgi:nitrogen-specific signal transduction histidine kinase